MTNWMYKNLFAAAIGLFSIPLFAQDISLALQKPVRLAPAEKAAKWEKQGDAAQTAFGNSSTRYASDLPPTTPVTNEWKVTAWRGERVHTQVLIWGRHKIQGYVQGAPLSDGKGNSIAKKQFTTGLVTAVWTDEFRAGCGFRKSSDFDSSLVADRIDTKITVIQTGADSLSAVWVSLQVPQDAAPGVYKGFLLVSAKKDRVMPVTVTVLDRVLPAASAWQYQLDLWQHPAAIARVKNLPLWSDAHFEEMRPYYQMLAGAGQKAISAAIVNEPWGHQTYDDFPSLIQWTRKADGTWSYDYTLFDKYVQFSMDCGIKQWIHCYSMVPWKIAFTFRDEKTGKDSIVTDSIGSAGYNAFWKPMLADFTKHLRSKGWFGITAIAMDERPMAAMQSVIRLLKEVDPEWKVTLAGSYHPEVEKDIFDYCLGSSESFPPDVLKRRKAEGKLSTWYTCCAEKYPNGFTFSPPDEHVWMGWYTAAHQLDGYLRWAFNSWTAKPDTDSRFTAWPAGDTYQVYPGPMSSIRFEKMIEGIQDFEKIKYLQKWYNDKKNTAAAAKLESALSGFTIASLATTSATAQLEKIKPLLNQ